MSLIYLLLTLLFHFLGYYKWNWLLNFSEFPLLKREIILAFSTWRGWCEGQKKKKRMNEKGYYLDIVSHCFWLLRLILTDLCTRGQILSLATLHFHQMVKRYEGKTNRYSAPLFPSLVLTLYSRAQVALTASWFHPEPSGRHPQTLC